MQHINSQKKLLSFHPPIIAHRGASALAPENTLAAFRKAKAIGAAWVEFDVMLTACGEAVVIHDETLERTTNGAGNVADVTLAYLQTLDAGSWFDKKFAGEKIPTLRAVIQLLNELQLLANIEIKPCAGHEQETVTKVLQIIAQEWKQQTPPLISSFSREVLYDVRAHSPQSVIGFLMHDWEADWQQACDELQSVTVHVYEKNLTPERVQEIKASDRLVLSYTVDDVKRAQELFEFGVSAIFSNCVDFVGMSKIDL